MSKIQTKILKSTFLLTFGKVGSHALMLVRNITLAKLLSKDDFGLVAAFALTISLFEIAGKMSIGMFLIQSKTGNDKTLQNTVHLTNILLGIISALLILAACRPIAFAFDSPDLIWAFAALAIIPIGQSFQHSDNSRSQRTHNFKPSVVTEFCAQLCMTAAIWPLYYLIKDFKLIIYLLFIKMLTGIIVSHVMSERPFRFSWDKNYRNQIFSFSWPLLINGFIMIAAQQADQFMVGSLINIANLGTYSVAIMLTMVPYSFAAHILGSVLMPILSKSQHDTKRFHLQYQKVLGLTALLAIIAMSPLILIGDHIIRLLYGEKFMAAGSILSILSIASIIRFLKIVPTTASISKADTANQMYSNVFRLLSIPIAFILYYNYHTIESIAYATVIGEAISFCASTFRLRIKHKISLLPTAKPIIFIFGSIAMTILLKGTFLIHHNFSIDFIATLFAVGFIFLISLKLFPFNSDLLHSAFKMITGKLKTFA